MKKLYANIGNKVCGLAKFCGFLGIAGIVASLICIAAGDEEIAFFAIPAGVMCILSSWPLYAFGQITNDIHTMKNQKAGSVSSKITDLPNL